MFYPKNLPNCLLYLATPPVFFATFPFSLSFAALKRPYFVEHHPRCLCGKITALRSHPRQPSWRPTARKPAPAAVRLELERPLRVETPGGVRERSHLGLFDFEFFVLSFCCLVLWLVGRLVGWLVWEVQPFWLRFVLLVWKGRLFLASIFLVVWCCCWVDWWFVGWLVGWLLCFSM